MTSSLLAVAASVVLAATCTDEPVEVRDDSRRLAASFDERFRIGDDPAERQFARISSMGFAPNGHLVVADPDEFAVVVFDRDGREVLAWGGEGEGPGEFETEPEQVAVSIEGRVAVRRYRQVDVFTSAGELLASHPTDHPVDEIAFDDDGDVLGLVAVDASFFSEDERQNRLVRLRDDEVLWSSPMLPPSPPMSFFQPRTVAGGLDAASVAVGINDLYRIDVLDTSTGRVLGRIAQHVAVRATPEALKAGMRAALAATPGMETASPTMASWAENMTFGETLPVFSSVFLGPPDRTVWVRRGIASGSATTWLRPSGTTSRPGNSSSTTCSTAAATSMSARWRSRRMSSSWLGTASGWPVGMLGRWASTPWGCIGWWWRGELLEERRPN